MSVEPPPGFRSGGLAPTGSRIVFIRHGEAMCNVEGRLGGPIGCTGLSDHGRQQAQELRRRLTHTGELDDVVALYSSVLPRAIETLDILRPALPSLAPTADCDWCEMHPGDADGLTWEAMIERFGAVDWDVDPQQPLSPGGESWVSMYERVQEALRTMAARHAGQRVVVATHGGVIEQVMKLVLATAPGTRLQLRTDHCSLTEVIVENGRVELLRYNDRAPLPRTR
jgi:probable phosphoglycerate mutase